jgi:hypothetical protein
VVFFFCVFVCVFFFNFIIFYLFILKIGLIAFEVQKNYNGSIN